MCKSSGSKSRTSLHLRLSKVTYLVTGMDYTLGVGGGVAPVNGTKMNRV